MPPQPAFASVLIVALSAFALVRLCPAATPPVVAPALEQAAAAFAQGELETAQRAFATLATDANHPPFVRGLARIGIAKVALARQDTPAARRAYQDLAEDPALPFWQRDLARYTLTELQPTATASADTAPSAHRVTLPALPPTEVSFHVAADGNDDHPGSRNRPFATLTRARDAVRQLKAQRGGQLPPGGVRIFVRGDFRVRSEVLSLSAEDSGTPDAPVVYQAEPGATPVFSGGVPLRDWQPVRDPVLREKLPASVRDRVVQADLKAAGIEDWGDATDLKRRPELFVNGIPQTLARWPNQGFVETGELLGTNTFSVWGTIAGCRDGKFKFLEDRPAAWVDEPDVRLYGYWFWDWYEEYQRVSAIDPAQRSFTLAQPFSSYGYRKGQRYHAVNVFRELDQPGEWYLDRRSGLAFWLPPETVDAASAAIVLSVLQTPFITLSNVDHVILLGLTFQEGRGDGVQIRAGSRCLVAGSTLRRLGGDAIVIDGGLQHGAFGCDLHTLGCGGLRVNGGDRKTLAPGHHFVENCSVADIARLKRTYAPAVHLDGCGNRIAHNRFERIPSSAMRIEGNDHLIELNQVRHVVQESDDQGGIDMFGNPLYRGVLIRWNRWTDIIGGTECGAAGIRLDDMISGIVLHGNLFERCGARLFGGVQIHGGKENVVDNNVFIDCHAGISFSRWDEPRWRKSVEPFLAQAGQEPYRSRYPDLARLLDEPNVNFISRNLVLNTPQLFLRDGGGARTALTVLDPHSVNPETLIQPSSTDPRMRQALLDPIPVSDIGLYPHPWRVAP